MLSGGVLAPNHPAAAPHPSAEDSCGPLRSDSERGMRRGKRAWRNHISFLFIICYAPKASGALVALHEKKCLHGAVKPSIRPSLRVIGVRLQDVAGRRLQPRAAAASDDRRGHGPEPSRPARGPLSSRVPVISRPLGRSEAFLGALPATLAADPLLTARPEHPLHFVGVRIYASD